MAKPDVGAGSMPSPPPEPWLNSRRFIEQQFTRYAGKSGLAIAGLRRDGRWCELSWAELAHQVRSIAGELVRQSRRPTESIHPHTNVNLTTETADREPAATLIESGSASSPSSSTSSSTPLLITRSDNSVDDVIEMLVAMDQGWIHCPIDHRLSPEIARRRRQAILEHQPPWGTSSVLWTSGTSGRNHFGRGVCLSGEGFLQNANAKLARVAQPPGSVRLTVLPICHAYARTCDIGTWLASGTSLVIGLGYDPADQLAERYAVTHINAVPSIAQRMLREAIPPTLRVLGVGGAALPADAFGRWQSLGVNVVQGYGMTETGPVICSADDRGGRASSVGSPVDGWQTRIRNQSLAVRGPALMLGYLDGGKHIDDGNHVDDDGFFETGDLVDVDADGEYRILGRQDERLTLANGVTVDAMLIEQEFENQFDSAGPVMLRLDHDGVLTMWTTGAVPCSSWVSSDPGIGKPVQVQTFVPPPSRQEINNKGGLRRGFIEQTRFAR